MMHVWFIGAGDSATGQDALIELRLSRSWLAVGHGADRVQKVWKRNSVRQVEVERLLFDGRDRFCHVVAEDSESK